MLRAAALVVALSATPVAAAGTTPTDPAAPATGSATMRIVVTIPPLDEIPMAPGAAATPATGGPAGSPHAAEGAPTLAVRADSLGYTAEVTGRETAPVELWDGERLVAVVPAGKGPAAFHSNGAFGELVARRGDCWSTPVRPPHGGGGVRPPHGGGGTPQGNVAVSIPAGALTLTIKGDVLTVADTRPGNLGFHVVATSRKATTIQRLTAVQVKGNAMRARDLAVPAGPVRLRAGSPTTVAVFPAKTSLGTVRLQTKGASGCLTWTVL